MDPLQLTIDVWNTTTPKSFTDSRMYMYQGPLLQLTIDLWNTTTPNTFNI